MWLYQRQRFESNRSIEKAWELLESNKHLIDEQLRNDFLSRMGRFRVKLNRGKNQLEIRRLLNPFWYYTVLRLATDGEGSVLEIKSVPQLFYDYIFLGLSAILFGEVAYNTGYIELFLMCYLVFVSIGGINLKVKYRHFGILTNFCRNVLVTE